MEKMTQQMFRMIVFVLGMLLVTVCTSASVDAEEDKTVEVNNTVQITATEGEGTTDSDDMIVTAITTPNVVPAANVGSDMNISLNNTVSITGSGSDSDGSIVSYQWKEGASVVANTAYTEDSVGTHTPLTVTDNDGATASDSMTVTVNAIPNQAPIAVISNIDLNLTREAFESIGVQLDDISLTYDSEVLRVNPPKGSKEFISGVKGTLEFIAYIDDMTANILDERNVFYRGGSISGLKYELLESPEGMIIEGKDIYWTPTAAQSAQNYKVRVKVYDDYNDNVEKIVAFDVYVAQNKYLHTEVQNGKLVVVDPTSKLDGLTVEPRDGSDPGLMKIKIAPDSLLPRPLYKEGKGIKLADAFMIENKPTKYLISIKNIESFMQKLGVSKMAFIYYLKHGETNHTSYSRSWELRSIKNGEIEVFNRNGRIGGADRPYFYFVTAPKFLLSSEEGSMTVTVNATPNQAPIAVISNIDLNHTREEFESIGVELDATQSTDVDGRIIKYEWHMDGHLLSQVSKSKSYGLVSNISSSEVEGTEHKLSLKVTDDKGATDTKTVHFTILPPSVGFLVKPYLFNMGYGIEHVSIDTNTIPENNVSIVVTSSKPNKLNGHTTKTLVFTPEEYKNISLSYSAPRNTSENYIIHFDVSHSDDINYEGLQLDDISLTYDSEVLRVNPPKGSKEFISGVKGTLEFIAYIDDMTANILDERNVFYRGGSISGLKYELLESPEGMIIEDKKIYWTPTAAQSVQNYQVRVKVYDDYNDNVEKIVAFDVYVAQNKYLHTEVQDGKLVVVDPNSNLNGLTIEPLDGSDINSIKIKIFDDVSVPDFSSLLIKSEKISDIFLVEPRPKRYNIGILDVEGLYAKEGTRKIAWAHYYSGGMMTSQSLETKWELLKFKDGKNRPTGWAANDDEYYFLVKKRNILQNNNKKLKSTIMPK